MIKILIHLKSLLVAAIGILFLVITAVAHSDIEQVQKLIAGGNLNEAITMTNRELARDPDNVTFRFLKGLILTRQEQLEQARDIFLSITRTNPELPEPYNNLAVIYAALGDFDKARVSLQEAINTHPSYATAHENIGDIYAKLASQAYNQALELDGDNNSAKAKLSMVNELFSMPGTAAPVIVAGTADKSSGEPQVIHEVASPPPVQPPEPVILAGSRGQEDLAVPVSEPVSEPVREPVLAASSITTPPVQEDLPEPRQYSPTIEPGPAASELEAGQLAQLEEERRLIALIKQTVLDWASVWSAQDVNTYLSHYSGDFTPANGQTINQWREIRRQRLSAPGAINVIISDLVVEMLGSEHAQATFTQVYQSDVYSDRVKKTLLLKLENNRWLITLEQT